MNILHLSTYDLAGGAARAAHRLHDGLVQAGENSTMLVERKSDSQRRTIRFQPSNRLDLRMRRVLVQRIVQRRLTHAYGRPSARVGLFTPAKTPYGSEILDGISDEVQIINLHWVSQFVDWKKALPRLAERATLVWTLHDMNSLTGGCHYSDGCRRFERRCGACPQLGSTKEEDYSRFNWREKEDALRKIPADRLHLVSPSRWLANESRVSSLLAKFEVSVIPYGLDTESFCPRPPEVMRDIASIPLGKFVLLFLAEHVNDFRKGWVFLLDALRLVAEKHEIYLLSVGSGQPEFTAPGRIIHRHLGRLDSDLLLSHYYSSGDVFVVPSIQDNLPQTVLEAVSCGTPVIGFDTGGIPDMIRPSETGLLARCEDAKDLAAQISWMIEHPEERKKMQQASRRLAEECFSLRLQARRYQELYRSLIEQSVSH